MKIIVGAISPKKTMLCDILQKNTCAKIRAKYVQNKKNMSAINYDIFIVPTIRRRDCVNCDMYADSATRTLPLSSCILSVSLVKFFTCLQRQAYTKLCTYPVHGLASY